MGCVIDAESLHVHLIIPISNVLIKKKKECNCVFAGFCFLYWLSMNSNGFLGENWLWMKKRESNINR